MDFSGSPVVKTPLLLQGTRVQAMVWNWDPTCRVAEPKNQKRLGFENLKNKRWCWGIKKNWMVLDYYKKISVSLNLCRFLYLSLWVFFCEFLFLIPSLCLQPSFCSFSSLLLAPSFYLFLSWALSSVLLSLPPPISAVLQIVHCFGNFQSCRVPVFLCYFHLLPHLFSWLCTNLQIKIWELMQEF